MSQILRPALALGAVFFAFTITACGDSVPEGDVAKIDKYTISDTTFDRWLKLAGASQPGVVAPDPPNFVKCTATKEKAAPKPVTGQPVPKKSDYQKQCAQEYDQLRQQVMSFLIRSTWLEAEAAEQGLSVSDKQAKAEFDKAVKAAFPKGGDYAKFLKSSGQTEADLVYRQTVQLLEKKITEKIQANAGKVSEAEIKDFYEKNKGKQFTRPAARDLRVVLTNDEKKAKEAKAALDDGASWARVIQQYSTDPTTKDADGILPNLAKGTGNPDLERAAFSAKPDTVVGPVKTSEGYYVLTVTKVTPRRVTSLKTVSKALESQILQQRRQAALASFGQAYQDKWRAATNCAKGYVVPDCSNSKSKPNSTVPPGAIPQPQPATPQGGQPQVPPGAQPQIPPQPQQPQPQG